MRSRIGIGRQLDDLLRERIDDAVSKTPRSSGVADGEWLGPEAGRPYPTAHRLLQETPRIDRTAIDIGEARRAGFDNLSTALRTAGHSDAIAGPLDELLREIDRRGVADVEPVLFQRPIATADRAPRDSVGEGPRERDEPIDFEKWTAGPSRAYDRPEVSGDRSPLSAIDQAWPALPLAFGFDAAVGERTWRSSTEPFAGPGLAAILPIDRSELPHGMFRRDGVPDDAGEKLRRGSERQEDDASARPLDAIARQLDDLAREVSQREGGATSDEIATFKHRLTALARETAIEAERKLLDGSDGARDRLGPTACEPELCRPEGVSAEDARHRMFEPRADRDDERSDFGDIGQCFDAPAMPDDRCRTEAVKPDLSFVLDSIALELQPELQGPSSDVDVHDRDEAASSKQDQLFAALSDRWLAHPDHRRGQSPAPDDRWAPSAVDGDLSSSPPARGISPSKKRLSRSVIVPIIRAGLAAVLAIAIVVPGAYFARSRMLEAPAAAGPTIVHASAPTSEATASGPLTIMPANTVARFQELVFQLPRLYGIYAINSGRLFELASLPGQAPDPRVAVSAAIPRPSHTTLPDGRVAFLLFRRDMATNIAERVPVRVVARIKRPETGLAAEPQASGLENAWTIRNIAIDFRVAPVEHNREMVLLLSEKSDFTFPAGRYALILKGQAYDFTVAGPITDPAQCLERVEAANGNFFHECQAPEAGGAEVSSREPPPLAARSTSKPRRPGELHARAADQPKAGKSR
jgi:hypothetical protein